MRLYNRPFSFLFLDFVRRLGDVVRVPFLGYFVHEPFIAKAVLDHPNVSNSDIGSYGAWFTQVLGESALINMEGLEHRVLKSCLREFFDEDRLEQLVGEELRRSVADLGQLLDRGHVVDLAEFMRRLSAKSICRVLGIQLTDAQADKDYEQIYRLSARLTRYGSLVKKLLSESEVASARAIHGKLAEYTQDAYEGSDCGPLCIIGGLKASGLSHPEVKGLLTFLLVAGTAVLTIAVPRVVAVMLDSGAFNELRANPALLKTAVDESLRFVTPSNILFRTATGEVTANGYVFPKGSRIYVVFYALMKHGTFFPQPYRFDIRRSIPNEVRSLWFGYGRHSCLGVVLAHKVMRAILEILLTLNGKIVVERRVYGRNWTFPGYKHFYIRLCKRVPPQQELLRR
ncbi:MAG TPA: cytochrome P450 [Xanthobacteraceae bacterium]|nr:cytochrome P450 [Xanthobacteraceae bacterium]